MAGDELMVEVEQEVARGPATGGVVPWVEKYRPATIDELQQQDQVCSSALLSSGRARRMRYAVSSSHLRCSCLGAGGVDAQKRHQDGKCELHM